MSFDISATEVNETARIHLVNSKGDYVYTDKGDKVEIEIYGEASEQHERALSALNRKAAARKGKPTSYEQTIDDSVELLVAISKTSYNLNIGGKEVLTPQDFRELYSNRKLFFIKDRVYEGLKDADNFLSK